MESESKDNDKKSESELEEQSLDDKKEQSLVNENDDDDNDYHAPKNERPNLSKTAKRGMSLQHNDHHHPAPSNKENELPNNERRNKKAKKKAKYPTNHGHLSDAGERPAKSRRTRVCYAKAYELNGGELPPLSLLISSRILKQPPAQIARPTTSVGQGLLPNSHKFDQIAVNL